MAPAPVSRRPPRSRPSSTHLTRKATSWGPAATSPCGHRRSRDRPSPLERRTDGLPHNQLGHEATAGNSLDGQSRPMWLGRCRSRPQFRRPGQLPTGWCVPPRQNEPSVRVRTPSRQSRVEETGDSRREPPQKQNRQSGMLTVGRKSGPSINTYAEEQEQNASILAVSEQGQNPGHGDQRGCNPEDHTVHQHEFSP